jgi:predicted dehydrogenase
MQDKVRWGILGTARIAQEQVIPAMRKCQWSQVAAVASRNLEKAREIARHFGIPKAYGSYEELLSDSDIEAIYNPLPNHLHVPWSIRCAESGKHVLCEKPIALSVSECRSLISARDKFGVKVAEAFAVRCHPQWHRVHEMIRSGAIGQLRSIAATFGFTVMDRENIRNVPEFGGGAIMDIGCYLIYIARFLFAEEPESVSALIDRDSRMQIDRLSSGMLRFPSGHCVFTCGIQNVLNQSVQLLGTAGRIQVPFPFVPHPYKTCQLWVDSGADPWGGGVKVEEVARCNQYSLQADHFSRAIRGVGDVSTPLEDSIRNMAVIEAAFESARCGQVVRPLSC